MKIDIVCQSIDNFGDVAVVWRLAKSLLQLNGYCSRLRLLVDDLKTFHQLVPEVSFVAWQPLQMQGTKDLNIVLVFHRDELESTPFFQQEVADVLIEAFGALAPESYYRAFCQEALKSSRVIIHLEYLTAEPWACEYHLLPSPPPWPGVCRYFFVPGFLPKTGGLIVDLDFQAKAKVSGHYGSKERQEFRLKVFRRLGWNFGVEGLLITIFSYEHSFLNFWTDLGDWLFYQKQNALILAFEGRSLSGVRQAFEQYISSNPGCDLFRFGQLRFQSIPFVSQSDYDDLILAGDFHIVRGEESWSCAVLSARPFLWHAYLQPQGHQKVKSDAFLSFLEPFFVDHQDLFQGIKREFSAFNHRLSNSEEEEPLERYLVFFENIAVLEMIMERIAREIGESRHLAKKMLDFLQFFLYN